MEDSIRFQTLPNGLTVVGQPNGAMRSAALTLLVPAGCAQEPDELNGLSALVQEMTLRGSGPRDNRQFVLDLDTLGVAHDESVGAAHAKLSAATLAENLPAALEILSQTLIRPHFPADELEPARQMIVQEALAIEDEPAQKAMIELRRLHYPDPWGRPGTGRLEAIERIGLSDIREFFERAYRPGGAILGLAGRFDFDAMLSQVEKLLGDWAVGAPPEPVERTVGPRYRHFDYPSNQTQIGIAWAHPPYCHPDYYRAGAGVGVLSGGMSSRLFTEVRERRGLCYGIHASCHTLRDRGAVFCHAGTSAQRAQETLDVTLDEIRRLAEGIGEDELARLKARIKSLLVMHEESSFARSASIAHDWYHLGRARTLEEIGRTIDELTVESVNAYLAEHPARGFTIVTLGPRELEVPGDLP